VPCGCGPSTNEAEPDAALASDPATSTSLAAATLDRCAAPSHRVHPAIVTEFLSAAVAVDPLRLQVSPYLPQRHPRPAVNAGARPVAGERPSCRTKNCGAALLTI